MSDLRKAAQQALEALEIASRNGADGLKRYELKELDDAITALRTVLAQPEPEPVAWMKCINIPGDDWDAYDFSANQYGEFQTPLYTAPPKCKPLTDQEIIEAIKHISHNEMSAFSIARAIENVLKNAPSEANKGTYDNP